MIKIERRENMVQASFWDMHESATYASTYATKEEAKRIAEKARKAIKDGAGYAVVRNILDGHL